MTQLRSIEIDFDVHKRIEAERKSFAESPNDVLRRLLEIEPQEGGHVAIASPPASAPKARPWWGKGVTLPHGTELRMEYNGRLHSGRIDDGRWFVEGKSFNSPSAAAGGVAMTKSGNRPSLDGWEYWHVRLPGEHDWTPLSALRRKVGAR